MSSQKHYAHGLVEAEGGEIMFSPPPASSRPFPPSENDHQLWLREEGIHASPTSSLDRSTEVELEVYRMTPFSDRGCPLTSLQTKAQLQSEYLHGSGVVAPVRCCWEGEDEFDNSSLEPLSQLGPVTYDLSSSHSCPPSPHLADSPLGPFPPTLEDRLQFAPFRSPEFEALMDNPGLPERIPVDGGYWQWQTLNLQYPYPSDVSILWIEFVGNDYNTPSPEPDFWDMMESSWVDQGRLP